MLGETSKDPTGFIAIKGAIKFVFMMKNPLVGHDVSPRGTRDKIRSLVFLKSGELIDHGIMPIGIAEGTAVSGRDWRNRGGKKVESIDRLPETDFAMGDHGVSIGHRRDGGGRGTKECSTWKGLGGSWDKLP